MAAMFSRRTDFKTVGNSLFRVRETTGRAKVHSYLYCRISSESKGSGTERSMVRGTRFVHRTLGSSDKVVTKVVNVRTRFAVSSRAVRLTTTGGPSRINCRVRITRKVRSLRRYLGRCKGEVISHLVSFGVLKRGALLKRYVCVGPRRVSLVGSAGAVIIRGPRSGVKGTYKYPPAVRLMREKVLAKLKASKCARSVVRSFGITGVLRGRRLYSPGTT